MTLEILLEEISKYNKDEIERVKKAYYLAEKAHENQKRESGEPYIIHPLNVCYNLTQFYADGATLCAGLLHDVVEDTKYTLEDIEREFDSEVAHLVDGVTKISNLHFNSKDEATNANIRRLINSLNDDVRIIIIKLCDRLHNMETLIYKAPEKQKRSAEETLNIFVPIAYSIGAFRLKCRLEDICLSYLEPEAYREFKAKEKEIIKDYHDCIEDATEDIKCILKENNINYNLRVKVLNIYHLYRKFHQGYKGYDIHDLVNFKITVDDEATCYQVLGLIHHLYTPMNSKFKDYIACPKTNKYRSIHTTVFGPDNHLIQVQIKTTEMDELNTLGLAAYWKQLGAAGVKKMQEELKANYQFVNNLRDLEELKNDTDYINRVKKEIFTNNVYAYTFRGDIIELPADSCVIDFAYKIHTDFGNHLYKAFINGEEVELTHRIKNKDRIFLLKSEKCHPKEEWLDYVVTSSAKKNINKYFKK